MEKANQDYLEHLWLAVNGELMDPGDIPDEFAPGKPCDLLYGEVTDARLRLAERTGIDFEDRDLLTIIEGLEKIGKYCAFAMYQYGEQHREMP